MKCSSFKISAVAFAISMSPSISYAECVRVDGKIVCSDSPTPTIGGGDLHTRDDLRRALENVRSLEEIAAEYMQNATE